MITFKQFLIEAPEESEELFDIRTKKDLITRKYHEFNKKYFDNALPTDITFEYKKLSGSTGQAVAKHFKGKLIPHTTRIIFNPIFKATEKKILGLLLHEMIHILNYTQGHFMKRWAMAHGPYFEEVRKRIEKESGIPILVKDEEEKEFAKEREAQCVLIYTKTKPNNPSYFLVSPKINLTIDMVETRLNRFYDKDNITKIEIWKGTTGFTSITPVMRSWETRLQTKYFTKIEYYDKLKANMKLVEKSEF